MSLLTSTPAIPFGRENLAALPLNVEQKIEKLRKNLLTTRKPLFYSRTKKQKDEVIKLQSISTREEGIDLTNNSSIPPSSRKNIHKQKQLIQQQPRKIFKKMDLTFKRYVNEDYILDDIEGILDVHVIPALQSEDTINWPINEDSL